MQLYRFLSSCAESRLEYDAAATLGEARAYAREVQVRQVSDSLACDQERQAFPRAVAPP